MGQEQEDKKTQKQIGELIDEAKKDESIKIDHSLDENALADMGEGAGWKVLLRKYRKLRVQLLMPISSKQVTSEANLMTIGANTLANARALEVLDEFVGEVETVRSARRNQIKNQGDSKKGA